MTYDAVIIGGGPAGYTAALYCVRAGMTALVVEKLSAGGQMATTSEIENYPGFVESVDGFDLGENMQKSAEQFGAKTVLAEVTAVDLVSNPKIVTTTEGSFEAKTVFVATGANPRELGLPEEASLRSRGVAYCATCDGMMYRGKTVIVVGGGNSAAEDAVFLSKICKKVYLVHRRDSLRATQSYMKKLESAENLTFVWNSRIEKILHDQKVTGAMVADINTGAQTQIDCDGIFVAVGRVPNTELFKDVLDVDAQGYLIADETTRTNIPGVFAIGDVRTKPLRQIVTAASDGATASKFAEEYLTTL